MAYTYNPQASFSPTNNSTATGTNIPQIPLPDPAAALGSQIPGLTGLNTDISSLLGTELSGGVSPSTMNLLQNKAATLGVTSGMPGSGFQNSDLLESLGLTSEGQQQAGVNNYASLIPTISGTQTLNPALQQEGNLQNAVDSAAPNPASAASEEQQLLQQYLSELNGPQGGENSSYFTPAGSNTKLPLSAAFTTS